MQGARGWRFFGFVVLLLAAGLAIAPLPVAAGTDHVTTCSGNAAITGSFPYVVAHASANDAIVFDLDCAGASAITIASSIAIGVNLTIDTAVGAHRVTVDGGCTASCGTTSAVGGTTVFQVNGGVTATINGLMIQHGNAGGGGGGGIANSGMLTVTNSTLTANSAAGGGGIVNGGTLTVTNSTLTANAASTNGGGLYNFTGAMYLTNDTITGNGANTSGGGLYINAGGVAPTNTILAGNGAGSDPDVRGTVVSGGHNLVGIVGDSAGWRADLAIAGTPFPAGVGPLQDNGGPTWTMAPLSGSIPIGAGDPAVCRQTGAGKVNGLDQRGLPRLPSTCDIGAVQTQGTHLTATASGGAAGAPVSLTVTLKDGDGNTVNFYSGTVHFTSSDPLATLPADYTFTDFFTNGTDNGTHIFAVTFGTAGTQTVTVTDTLSATLTAQAIVAVTPVLASVSPASGGTAGGNHVTITGLGFGTAPGSVTVSMGGSTANVVSVTNTQLVVIAPPHAAGAANVAVTVNGQGTTLASGYTYGTVTTLPAAAPPGAVGGSPGAIPGTRPASVPQGTPIPLPRPRHS